MCKEHLIVVGGSRGIGRAFCHLVAAEWRVVTVLSRRTPENADHWPEPIKFENVDICCKKTLFPLLQRLIKQWGNIGGLVFFQRYRGEGDSWDGHLETCLTASRNVIEGTKDGFVADGDKAIVITASTTSKFVAGEQDEGYHAVKSALTGLCRYYAYQLGPSGIRVNCVSPGTLLKYESKDFFIKNPKLYTLYRQITPLRRMGTSDDIARVVRFLLSEDASFITGQEIIADGGVSIQWQESLTRSLIQ